MQIALFWPRNIIFDHYVFFPRKQKQGETAEQFYSVLTELAENCDFENREEVIIRDIFITNVLDDDIQRELLRDTVGPCSSDQPYPTQYYVSPRYEGPETSKMVSEAECASDFRSD